MKTVFVIFVFVMTVAAEPPRYRQRLQRLEEAPYAASGYRPAGAQFRLPSRLENVPEKYGPPPHEYEAPIETTTEELTTEEPSSTTIQPQSEKLINGREEEAEEVEVDEAQVKQTEQNDQPQQQGVYYFLLPTGQLQKVQYLTAGSVANAAYRAELQFQNVDPIRGPVYAFGSNAQLIQYV